jgi:hypothetical protein
MPCSTLDYLPTIKKVIGFKMPDKRPIDGVDLTPVIDGALKRRPKPIPLAFHKANLSGRHGSPPLALVDGDFKFLADFSYDCSGEMLFNLREDPGEKLNVLADHPRRAERMRQKLLKLVDSFRRSHSGADYPNDFKPVNDFPF